jgi:hypothetical protein
MLKFDPQQEKKMYQQTRKDKLGPYWIALTSYEPVVVNMTSIYDFTISGRKLQQVSTLK